MTGFLIDPDAGGFLSEDIPAERVTTTTTSFLTQKRRKQDLKQTTGLSSEEIDGLTDSNAIAYSTIGVQELAPEGAVGLLEGLIEEGVTLEELETASTKKQRLERDLADLGEVTAVSAALTRDPKVSGALFQVESRASKSRDILTDLAERFEDGAFDKVLEVIDMLGYETYAGIRDVIPSLKGEGTEYTELTEMWSDAMRTIDDEEDFDKFIQSRIDTITGGIASGTEPAWRVVKELQALDAAGSILWEEELGVLYGASSLLDIATLGAAGAVTGWRAGRSVIGRLRGSAGTRVATEATLGTDLVLRTGLDGEILDPQDVLTGPAGSTRKPNKGQKPFIVRDDVEDVEFSEILDDIMPMSESTRVRPQGIPTPPPVSVARVAQRVAENQFIKQFLHRQSKFSFGNVDFKGVSEEWAGLQARKLSSASGTRVLNWDIEEQDIQQGLATFFLGKSDGTPFSTFDAASDLANKTPNSKVVDTRTGRVVTADTGTGEYAVTTEMRVPYRDMVRSSDLSEIRNRGFLSRLFGRADQGSSTFMSNLADMGDYGAGGYTKDFQKILNTTRKDLGKSLKTIDSILTTLRDTPNNGNPRGWLTASQFTESFRRMEGRLPTRDEIRAYETLVELSDFSWYVKANERLQTLANQKATVVQTDAFETFAFPTERTVTGLKSEGRPIWVLDAATGKKVSVKKLADNAKLLEFGTRNADGTEFVTNFIGKTRVPTLTDAFPYNAGGPRSNPDISWFVGNEDGSWATLIGARSQRDADIAVKEFNNIAATLDNLVGDKADGLATLNRSQRAQVDEVIRNNRKWNPEVETAEDFVEFTKQRGVPFNKPVVRRGRGEKLGSFLRVADRSLYDLDLQSYTSYHRHDQALLEFGGTKASNPDPIEAIYNQYNGMVTRAVHTQYRMNHPTAWWKAVQKALKDGEIPQVTDSLAPMTDEMRVKNVKITGNSIVARKLRQEQSVINRRLDMLSGSVSALPTDMIGMGMSKSAQWASEQIHNVHPKLGPGGQWLKKVFIDEISNRLLSLGFFQKMGSIDQVWLQSTHIGPISMMSPKNGPRAITVAGFVRQAARMEETPSAWTEITKGISRAVGLDDVTTQHMLDDILDSGRGYMRGAIAEDPTATSGARGLWGNVKYYTSVPYYAGENFAATTSRVTAFLDTIDEYPTVPINSRQFKGLVTERDRTLSLALNKSQKSLVQSDPILRVATQWSSYPLRTLGAFTFAKGLTPEKKLLLAGYSTILWGLGGLGLNRWAANVQEAEGMNDFFKAVVIDGLDSLFDTTLGIKVGQRLTFNPIELWERSIGTVSDPFQTVPALQFVQHTGSPVLNGMQNAFSGRWSLLSHDVETLVRAWKIVDSPYMAYTMALEDARISKTGSKVSSVDGFTSTQIALQAIGISPSEAVDMYRATDLSWGIKKRKDAAITKGAPIFAKAMDEAEKGNMEAAYDLLQLGNAVVMAYNLSDTHLSEVRETIVSRYGFERTNYITLQLLDADYRETAVKLSESIE